MIYEIGQKVRYLNEKGDWAEGTIHGVQSHESPGGHILNQFYLVDTGKHERIDEYVVSHHAREVSRRSAALVAKGADPGEALAAVLKHKDLPDDKKYSVEKVRQPEQVTLSAEQLRPL